MIHEEALVQADDNASFRVETGPEIGKDENERERSPIKAKVPKFELAEERIMREMKA